MTTKPLWTMDAPGRIASPVPGFEITTPYGKRPNDGTYWQARGHHTGDDYADADGSGHVSGKPVVAVLGGRAFYRGRDKVLGNVVLLYATIGGRPFTFWYCHLSGWAALTQRPGRIVTPGTVLGRVGQTGTGARGPHLHLEKRAGWTTSWSGADLAPRW